MALPRASPPRDLTLPRRGSTTVRALYSAALREGMRVASGLTADHPAVASFRASALPALAREPALFAAAMRQPSRLTLARCLAHAGDATPAQRAEWESELAAQLLVDVAEAGALDAPVVLDAPPPVLFRERAAIAIVASGAASWSVDRETLRFRGAGSAANVPWSLDAHAANAALAPVEGRAEVASVPLFGDVRLLLRDNNPLVTLEAHPDKAGNALDLGGHAADEWAAAIVAAHAVLREHLPEIADEMDLFLRHVGPVGYDESTHLSASYLEAAGVVYLSLHPHRMTLAEALVHEFQHNKLNLLLATDPILENGFAPLFASPVRPDPRPLRGVLLAVHAFQPIARMYERMEESARGPERAWLARRRSEVVALCREGCDVLLPNARPTAIGAPLLDEIAALHAALT